MRWNGGETELDDGLRNGDDGTCRCAWAGGDGLYQAYHDTEWGRPTSCDRALFEKLCLEGFQAGLSWITILRKREAFHRVFHGFKVERVAAMDEEDVEQLLADPAIVRHRGKIEAAIGNARAALGVIERHGSLASFLWAFEPGPDRRPPRVTASWVAANSVTPASTALSKALRREGFRFVGPTTIYAFMQSMGFVNDHIEGCHVRAACDADRAAFARPRPKGGTLAG